MGSPAYLEELARINQELLAEIESVRTQMMEREFQPRSPTRRKAASPRPGSASGLSPSPDAIVEAANGEPTESETKGADTKGAETQNALKRQSTTPEKEAKSPERSKTKSKA